MFQRKPGRFRHRSNDRSPRRLGHGHAQRSNSFSNGHSRNGFRPTQSPVKLLEKYNILAKEALSSGDKILSENYLQHADHFERMISLKNSNSNQNGNSSQDTSSTKAENNNLSNDSAIAQDQIIKDK
tara:strand:- start:58 stop:438 length:381 start_codon:yes stop_codon:yes gene_type:complete